MPAPFFYRGELHQARKEYAKATADLDRAIDLPPQQGHTAFSLASAHERRGLCRMVAEQLDEALRDFTDAIRLGPTDPAAVHELRADVFELKDRAEAAKFDRQVAAGWKRVREKPDDGPAQRELAALLTHGPDATLCEPKIAVELATRACELSGWKDAASLDTLAAAARGVGAAERGGEVGPKGRGTSGKRRG